MWEDGESEAVPKEAMQNFRGESQIRKLHKYRCCDKVSRNSGGQPRVKKPSIHHADYKIPINESQDKSSCEIA